MRAGLAALMMLAGLPADAVTCEDTNFRGTPFTLCTVDATSENLRMFLRDGSGAVLGQFSAVESLPDVGSLPFAMNAGMYHDDRSPVGLYVEDGTEVSGIVTSAGPGNFGLLPNGVLCLTDTSARVYESRSFAARRPSCRDATQSGPMLVIGGALHPRLIPGGTSRNIRNGVGTSADGSRAVFAISNAPVNFHDFGSLFRDHLGLPDALFLDGNVSRLHAPQLGRSDSGFAMGPIIAVTN